MIKLLVISDTLNYSIQHFLLEWQRLGNKCFLCVFPGQQHEKEHLTWFNRTVDDIDSALSSSDLILAIIDTMVFFHGGKSWVLDLDLTPYQHKLVIDFSRGALNLNRIKERFARKRIAQWGAWLIVRDEKQLILDNDKKYNSSHLLIPGYLTTNELPRPALADLFWFLYKRLGQKVIPLQISRFLDELYFAPVSDQQVIKQAKAILKIDPYFLPAILRIALPQIISNQNFPESIGVASSIDPYFFTHLIKFKTHFADDTPIGQLLGNLERYCFPRKNAVKKRVLIFVAKKQRDLYIDLLLAYHLEKLGYEVFFRHLYKDITNTLPEITPHAVVWVSRTTPTAMAHGYMAKKHGIFSIVRRQEQGPNHERWKDRNDTYRKWWIGGADYTPLVDIEFFNHMESRDITTENGHIPADKTDVIGNTLLDPYFIPNIRNFVCLPRTSFCKSLKIDPNKKNMLWTSRWVTAGWDSNTCIPEALMGKTAEYQDDINKRIQEDLFGRRKWLEALSFLYGEIGKEWNFILKVHPGEKSHEYEAYFTQNNLKIPVLFKDYLIEVIGNIDLLIHAGSNTAREAHLLNIPSLAFMSTKTNKNLIYQLSPNFYNTEDLLAAIKNVKLGQSNANLDIIKRIELEWAGKTDGNSCRRMAEKIDHFLKTNHNDPYRFPNEKFQKELWTNDDPANQNVKPKEAQSRFRLIKKCFETVL